MTDTLPAPAPAVDVPLLRKVLEHLTAHPDQHEQRHWWLTDTDTACGTAGCIAGWTVALARPDLDVYDDGDHRPILLPGEPLPVAHVCDTARALLGLPFTVAAALFRGQTTLRDLWQQAEFISGGAITVPAELPDGS